MTDPAPRAAAHPAPGRRRRACPVCGRGPLAEGQRFCSDRCVRVDLGRWLGGDYAIPATEPPEGWPDAGGDDTEGAKR